MDVSRVVEILTEWVNIPSINPDGGSTPQPLFGELRMAERLGEDLRRIGCRVEFQEVEPQRPNVLGLLECAGGQAPLVILDAHTDTVGIPDDRQDLLRARVEGTSVIGRGTADTKGPTLAYLLALERIAADPAGMKCNLLFAGVMGEEMGLTGTRHLLAGGIEPAAAIVAEPTGFDVIVAHKGVVRWRITARGIPGHGAEPDSGKNAIAMAARFINALEEQYTAALPETQHPLLGPPTFNVGRIEGGVQFNIIPDRCTVHLERRCLPSESPVKLTESLKRLIDRIRHPGDEFEVEDLIQLGGAELSPDHPLAEAVLEAARVHHGSSTIRGASWAAASGAYFSRGIPAVVFGPGSISEAHTNHERIDAAEILTASRIVEDALRGLDPRAWD